MAESGGFPRFGKMMVARGDYAGLNQLHPSSKIKEIKIQLKALNKDCFDRVEVNKKLTLAQVEAWDRVEKERSLSLEKIEAKKEAKDSFKRWITLEKIH